MPELMKSKFFLILVLFALCSSCNDDDFGMDEYQGYTIDIKSFIVTPAHDTIPDVNSDIYIYFGYNTIDFIRYDLLDDGIYAHKFTNDTIFPDIHDKISADGKTSIQVEDFQGKDRLSLFLVSSWNNDITVSNTYGSFNKHISFTHYIEIDN